MSFNKATFRYLHTLCLIFMAGAAFAQSSWDPGTYAGIPKHDKVNVFFDDFNDGRNWSVNPNAVNRTEKVYNGEFYIISYGHEPVYKLRSQPLDTQDDYEMEMRFRFMEGFSYTMAGLAFGGDNQNSHYRFITDVYGNYEISIHDRGYDKVVQAGQTRRQFEPKEYRTLSLRKVKDQWYFFISEELVHQMPEMDFFGDRMGFRLGGSRTMLVDYYRVSNLQSSDILGPTISLNEPLIAPNQTLAIINDERAYITGRLTDQSGIESLMINGQPISFNSSGEFSASLRMPPNKRIAINLEARDIYGNLSKRDFYMEYQQQQQQAVTYTPPAQNPSNAYAPALPASVNAPLMRGQNYLVVIGVNNYRYWSFLNNAVKDCHDVIRTLTEFYMFEPQNVFTLFNEDATRENILELFETVNARITEDDNLLVYYAGHGYYNTSTDLGYWVPFDARKDKVSDFIGNSTIRDYMREIDTHNTLLIADACYSGSLFGTSRGNNYQLDARSRWAFTSGDIEKVWDGQPGQNSPFARYLISYLKSNTKAELTAYELVEAVSSQVRNNTQQKPVGAPLKLADDQGGMYIFYRR